MSDFSPDDLREGDWLLFQGDPESWLSKAIMMLTDSDVSHAALYIGEGKVAEEIGKGLVETPVGERLVRTTYVMRRRSPEPDLSPVLRTAREYLDEGEKYAFSNLVLLGMILLYKRFTPGSARRRAMIKVYKLASLGVFKLLEKFRYEGKTPMVCSQFVYECFAKPSDLDPDLRLVLEDPLLEAAPVDSLVDELVRYQVPTAPAAAESIEVGAELDPEEVARALVMALEAEEAEAGTESAAEAGVDDELYRAASEFAALAAPLLSWGPPEGDSEKSEGASRGAALETMADNKSYFVAPSDLLKVRNGIQVAIIPPQPKPSAPADPV